jgi:hypothetical protein
MALSNSINKRYIIEVQVIPVPRQALHVVLPLVKGTYYIERSTPFHTTERIKSYKHLVLIA